jgi:4-hydroxybenzoate polyprenyltransferase
LKKRFPAKTLIGAIGVAIVYLFGGASVGVISWSLLYIASLMFAVTLAINPLLDLPDLEGDIKRGCKTLAIVLGSEMTAKFAMAVLLSATVLTTLYAYMFELSFVLPLLVGIFCLSFTWITYPLLKPEQDREYGKRMIKKMIPIHFLFQISLILTALQ